MCSMLVSGHGQRHQTSSNSSGFDASPVDSSGLQWTPLDDFSTLPKVKLFHFTTRLLVTPVDNFLDFRFHFTIRLRSSNLTTGV